MKNSHIQPQQDDLAQTSTVIEKNETQETHVQQMMGCVGQQHWQVGQEESLPDLEATLSGPPPHTEAVATESP